MISANISEEKRWIHEQANHACYDIISHCINLVGFTDFCYNNKVPGIILKCNNLDFNYTGYVTLGLTQAKVIDFFIIKEYNSSIQINLKKEYIKNIADLDTLLKLKGFYG